MEKKGFKPHMNSRRLIANGFYKGQAAAMSFMARGAVR